jgi:hypothetical protein
MADEYKSQKNHSFQCTNNDLHNLRTHSHNISLIAYYEEVKSFPSFCKPFSRPPLESKLEYHSEEGGRFVHETPKKRLQRILMGFEPQTFKTNRFQMDIQGDTGDY